MHRRSSDRMSDLAFRAMVVAFRVSDFFNPYIDRRVPTFGIQPGMTVVDYGCGPGRYTRRFARLVGESGMVYAVDVQPLAVEMVRREAERLGLANVRPVLARGYDSGLPGGLADVVCALDMFFAVSDPTALLVELRRITRPQGRLILDDGHQPRRVTLAKLQAAGCWRIAAESRDHLVCVPLPPGEPLGERSAP